MHARDSLAEQVTRLGAASALVAALFAASPAPSAAAGSGPRASGSIVGHVLDDRAGFPVAHAIVTCIAPNAKRSVKTTALGTFLVHVPAPDTYIIDVRAAGYWNTDQTEIKVTPGKTTNMGTIRLYQRPPGDG